MSPRPDVQHARVVQARVNLVLDQPFFGALALRLELRADPAAKSAMWTDGRVLGYNPAEVAKLSADEIIGVVAHEVMHCALGHPWRRDARDAGRWNKATDYTVNPLVVEAGMVLPEGALIDPQYAGMAAEGVYAMIPEPVPAPQAGPGDEGEGGTGDPDDDEAPDAASGDEGGDEGGDEAPGCGEVRDADAADPGAEAEWQVATFQAAQAAKARGHLPAGLARLIEEARRPRVDWRAALRRFVQVQAREDYSWRMPSTRYLAAGLYLPSLRSESMPPVVVAVDTSGSIDGATLAAFAAEVQAIADECAPERLVAVSCDAAIQSVEEFERGDLVILSPKGGGGTDFRPVFDHVEREGLEPACLVYLTDLDGTMPSAAPDYQVLWVSTTRTVAPWGETIELEAGS